MRPIVIMSLAIAPAAAGAQSFSPATAVAEIRRVVAESYVLPEKRPALDAVLADGLASGRYDTRDPAAFARTVDADLTRVGRDRHLNIRFDPAAVAMMTARRPDDRPDMAAFERKIRAGNHGVQAMTLLSGNVRLVDLRAFDWIGPESEAALGAAMEFLRGGDAAIIDIRQNGGGHPLAVQYVVSHFLAPDKPLITFYEGGKPLNETASLPEGKVRRMLGKPLYVLVGPVTGSAAEEFAGHVAGYRLGELVGVTTSGGGYMNRLVPVGRELVLSVSVARAVLASTGKDWEAVGIAPSIAAEPERALDVAHVAALKRIGAAR